MQTRRYTSKREQARMVADCTPLKDLLFKQRTGKFLNPHEKEVLKKYSEERRKENLRKKR